MVLRADRERTVSVVAAVVTLMVLLGYVALSDSPLAVQARGLVGAEDRLAPEVAADGTGSYGFLHTTRGGAPVGFSPCEPVRYLVNPQGAPSGWENQIEDAVAEVESRTGLVFEYLGTTDDRSFDDRLDAAGNPEPVLIGWADAAEVGDLADDVAGLGGPTMVGRGRLRAYVTGIVVLDREVTDELQDAPQGARSMRGLLLHELGHLVGLAHVDDPGELMYPRGTLRSEYGPGDLAGLARIGAVPCV